MEIHFEFRSHKWSKDFHLSLIGTDSLNFEFRLHHHSIAPIKTMFNFLLILGGDFVDVAHKKWSKDFYLNLSGTDSLSFEFRLHHHSNAPI